jgi:hypothetical protein
MKPRDLPADLIREWAQRQTAASAKLEGREVPDDFVRSVQAQQFLATRKQPTATRPLQIEMETLWG